ncbi:MAG: hypothetical protein Q4G33_02445 [bacterium]|nr:hypothetical protein [bacterium]
MKENCLYELNPEFLYTYLIVHLRRHLIGMGGGGIKLILDLWVLNRTINFNNKDKLNCFIHEAKLDNLREYAEALTYKWFEDKDTSDKNVLMLEKLIFNSDTHGNYGTYVNMILAKENNGSFKVSKLKNFIKLMCPSLKVMQDKYEVLKRYPILLPFSWVKRVFDARREHIKAIAESVNNLNKNEAQELARFCEYIEH